MILEKSSRFESLTSLATWQSTPTAIMLWLDSFALFWTRLVSDPSNRCDLPGFQPLQSFGLARSLTSNYNQLAKCCDFIQENKGKDLAPGDLDVVCFEFATVPTGNLRPSLVYSIIAPNATVVTRTHSGTTDGDVPKGATQEGERWPNTAWQLSHTASDL